MRNATLEFIEAASPDELDDAMNVFLAAPSFSTKQKALDLLLRKICQDSLPPIASACIRAS